MTTTATIAIIIYNTISSTFSSLNALSDTLQLVKKPVIVTKAVNIENLPKSRIILSRQKKKT